MEQIKIWVVTDKETGELLNNEDMETVEFYKRSVMKKELEKIYGKNACEIRQAILTIRTKGFDY